MRRLAALLLLVSLPCATLPRAAGAASSADLPDPAATAKVADGLIGHRATYTLTLGQARGDLAGAEGKMGYEVTDACDGWAVRQRLDMTITNRDGQPIHMISDYTTYESKDGKHLTFRMRQTTDEAVTQQVEGTAELDRPGGTGQVHYTVPKDSTTPLPPGTLFPMWHTATIIAAAEAGTKFLAVPLFDGTGPDGAQDSSVIVTNWNKPGNAPFPALADQPSGHVHVAFFTRGKHDTQPDYEVSMRYWENGVADELRMDFGDFVMNGKLAEFTPEPGHC